MPQSQEVELSASKNSRLARNYNRAAWFYEASAHIYSTGQIKAAKVSQLRFLEPGQSIMYLGVGAGEDALRAARKGLKVTCLDISQSMLDRLGQKLKRENLSAELICGDAFEHDRPAFYDAVATNFFLNCFRRDGMRSMLRHAATLLRPAGYYFVADVSPPVGTLPSKVFNIGYSKWAMTMFWAMKLVPWHENYDYAKELESAGLPVESVDDFRLAKLGPVMFRSVVARKPTDWSRNDSSTDVQQIQLQPHLGTGKKAEYPNQAQKTQVRSTQIPME